MRVNSQSECSLSRILPLITATTHSMQSSIVSLALLFLLACSPLSYGQDETEESLQSTTEEVQEESTAVEQQPSAPFEVIVNPILNIGDLEKLIEQAEDDMFAKYNELNLDDDYDILCQNIRPTGSHIRVRSCEPVFLDKARADNHSFFMFMLTRGGGVELLDDRTLQRNHQKEYEELQRRMEAFTGTDAEFRALTQRVLDLRAALRER